MVKVNNGAVSPPEKKNKNKNKLSGIVGGPDSALVNIF